MKDSIWQKQRPKSKLVYGTSLLTDWPLLKVATWTIFLKMIKLYKINKNSSKQKKNKLMQAKESRKQDFI